MRVTKEEIEEVKKAHDLKEVIESYGIKLKKKGSNYVGLCPFHEEKTPSFTVNPKTRLYHCFGCNAGGDVIGFVTKKEGIGFREAMNKLVGAHGRAPVKDKKKSPKATAEKQKEPPSPLTAVPQPHPHPDPLPDGEGSKGKVNHTRLLNRVVSFYHKSFCEDNRGMEYLKSRGISDNSLFSDFQIGFSNGTLLNTIPEEGDIIEALKEIGILNDKGNEMFYNCVVFPIFDENKDCVGLYGRRIKDGETAHLYLPGPWRGVFNFQAAKRSKSIILTESIIDALTLYNAGFKDVIPCYGVNGYTKLHLELFKQNQTKEIYLCFDRDEAGKEGVEKLSLLLKEKGLDAYIVKLPGLQPHPHLNPPLEREETILSPRPQGEGWGEGGFDDKVDLNSFFSLTAEPASIFERLLKEANPRSSIRSDKIVKHEQRLYEKTDTGFIVQYEARRYDVRGVVKDNIKLKATIKASSFSPRPQGEGQGEGGSLKSRFHLDTVDLYSNRSRLFFAKACAVLFSEKEEVITEDITRLIDLCEAYKPEDKGKASFQKMTRTEEEEALDFLKDASLFNRLLSDFETVGLTGEDANKLMGYLAATSRKLDEPLSVLIQSRSAAGKSTLQDAVLSLIPQEDYIKYTRLTGQALFYKEEDSLVHKLLAIEEEHGARDASYSIRNIQSSKYLSIAATGKDPVTGKLRTEEYRVKGPVSLMITTTEVELDYETSNRFIILTIDESKEMTARILQKQRERDTLEGLINKAETEHITKRHHNAQRLLRPLHVTNDLAKHLTFPSESLRARRDHKKYLGLIKAIAFLHQYQREIKTIEPFGSAQGRLHGETIQYIEVELSDIEKANELAGVILGRSLDELSPPSRLLLEIIREMVEINCKAQNIDHKNYSFTRKDIRDFCKWSDFQIKCHVKQLEDLEYLYSVTGKKGKEYIYELIYAGEGDDGKPFLMGLIDIDELKKKIGGKG